MINLYYWTTPNGHKIVMALEEFCLEYKLIPINIGEGEQFSKDFTQINPNQKIPAIVDFDSQSPVSIFESGAILLYLAEKSGVMQNLSLKEKYSVIQWLTWQVAGLGPMAGQNHHFSHYASERLPYAINRYVNETSRLYSVMDMQLSKSRYLAGEEYSIADIACFPWVRIHEYQSQDINDYPNLKRWLNEVYQRPSTIKALEIAKSINQKPTVSEQSKHWLFNQSKVSIKE